jgi:hypothetical protein
MLIENYDCKYKLIEAAITQIMYALLYLLALTALMGFVFLVHLLLPKNAESVTPLKQHLIDRPEKSEDLHRREVESNSDKRDTNNCWKTRLHKDLYLKIQNLEYHEDILPLARRTLLGLFHEGLHIERTKHRKCSILDIKVYDKELLRAFLSAEDDMVTSEWEDYTERRAKGSGPELFSSRESAIKWLKNQAPLKLMDGAWLGHIHKITTPFAIRGVTKDAWQHNY